MLNEEEIEALFMRYGFTILHPEQLSIQDQVRLFSRARMIAGPRGSGLHNIVFARPDTPLLLLTERRSVPPIDTFLMRADGTLAYAMGDVDPGSASLAIHLRDFTVDPGLAERALRSHFGL
jgi:capsular polysaccharide biosynthesis protein